MERIQYRELDVNVMRVQSCERTRVYDAANNYLHTHWDFTTEVNWQPSKVAYTIPGGAGTAPVATPGTLPGITDVALLNRLLQPRGTLTVTAGGSIILDTPILAGAGRLPCDVKGGPSVEMVGAPIQIGTRHWMVTLHFIADVRDQAPGSSYFAGQTATVTAANAVISNLWVGGEDIDENRRSVRRFSGRAILRADVMRLANLNANNFRDLYLFPCPNHYQRRNVSVQLSADGTILDWSFEDAMRGYNLGVNSPITHIECFRTGHIRKGSPARALTSTLTQSVGQILGGNIMSGLGGAPARTVANLADNLPKYYLHCRCDIIGDRNANLGFLTAVALGVCLNQLSIAGINDALTGLNETTFRQDVADQVYTSVEMTRTMTDDALIAIAAVTNGTALIAAIVGANDTSLATMGNGSAALFGLFEQDQTLLLAGIAPNLQPVVAPAGNSPSPAQIAAAARGIVANRSPTPSTMYGNPPFRQGAFGVIPPGVGLTPPGGGNTLNTLPGQAFLAPTGAVPVGIEHLIVQSLVGQNVTPPGPGTLTADS